MFFLNFPTVPVEAKQSKARPDIHSLFASPVVAFQRIGSHCMNKLYEVLLYNISTSIQPRFFPPFVETFVEFFMRYISKKNPEVFTGVGPTAHFSVGTQAFSRPFSTVDRVRRFEISTKRGFLKRGILKTITKP